MNQRHWAASAAVKAATNSASVEPDAVTVWVSLLHAITPPRNVKTCPVIDLRFCISEPQLVSTKPISLGCEMGVVELEPCVWRHSQISSLEAAAAVALPNSMAVMALMVAMSNAGE